MMNKFILLTTGLTMMTALATSQQWTGLNSQDTSFLVNAGIKLNDVIPAKHIYHYTEFTSGKVFFRDGSSKEAKLNYNRLVDEMHFINKYGDTLALADEPTIRLICIDKDSFYFDKGYIMLVRNYNAVQIGMKQGFRQGDRRRHTGYNTMSSTSSVTSLSSVDDGRRVYELQVKQQVLLSTVTKFYLGDKYNHFVPATKNNLRNLFPSCNRSIQKFCRKNDIDFGKREDLERVISFVANSCR